jgi:hypothetical protein
MTNAVGHGTNMETEIEIDSLRHQIACLEGSNEMLRERVRQLQDELRLSKAPVIGECEECGHKIVTPLRRL